MQVSKAIRSVYEQGAGILRLAPNFVPRRFSSAGRRLRLHPDDYFALGTARGSIKERWFSSVIPAMNGPLAPPDEGMSYVDPTGTAGGPIPLQGRGRRARGASHRRGPEAEVRDLADVLEVLRLTRRLSFTTCTCETRTRGASEGWASPRPTTSRPS